MQILQRGEGKPIVYLDKRKGTGKMKAIWVEEVDEWLDQGKQDGDIKEILNKTLSGKPRLGLCRYAQQFKTIAREEPDNNEYKRENQRIEGNEKNLLLE